MSKRTEMWIAFFSLSLLLVQLLSANEDMSLAGPGKSTVNVYRVAIGFPEDNGGKNVWTRIGEGRDYYQQS